ncbi:SGNH/GDSL hydrolase family protein [Flavobacterium lacus]|uniref:GDSL-like lipase/acylhydrolase family protein n=1 Tax=Flavobacterium lacus TaxID=1353778 RepID=A0A328WUA9_9FLAO|nr:G-D-S-L family lipolytic protein [Flavobacterium lacus]RAR48037.1 GDSL-like lipase/acylhydrolase family protein [Flavobacterium lacus]
MIKNNKWLLLVALTMIACSDDDAVIVNDTADGLPLTAGSADFSKFVSVGNSLTAGFSDNALFIEGQVNAYPAILASQFALVGGGEFRTPLMNDNVGGLLLGGNIISGPRLFFNGTGPAPVSGLPTTEVSTVLTGPFNNMGVPGAKSFHLVASGYGNVAGVPLGQSNPYYVRFASSPSATILGDAVAQNPTFFSLWIGNNDVLSYATSGGIGTNQTGNLNPATYGGNDITDPNVFASVYSSLLDGLTAGGAKGVVANIPNVTSVPFFTTVPTNPIPGLPGANATSLNQLFGGINAALAGAGLPARYVTLLADDGNPATVEANPLLIVDESLVNISAQITAALTPIYGAPTATFLGNLYGQTRHASNAAGSRDYILLTASGIIGTTTASAPAPFNTVGVSFPMQDNAVLTADETAQVKTATDAYNATIQSLATAKGLAFVDANATLNQVASGGINANNFTVTSNFVTGGGFSLDGVHPSPRGYALIANKFFEAINATYGSNFKVVNIGNYRILYPAAL